MNNFLPNLIAMIFFALLLSALLVAFIFRKDFRNAVLGGPGEATVFGVLSVKGVAIVLLCGLLIAGHSIARGDQILLTLGQFGLRQGNRLQAYSQLLSQLFH